MESVTKIPEKKKVLKCLSVSEVPTKFKIRYTIYFNVNWKRNFSQVGGSAAAVGELNKKLAEAEKSYEKAQEEVKHLQGEMERLLQLVQMSQEEQNAKERTIMELQQ